MLTPAITDFLERLSSKIEISLLNDMFSTNYRYTLSKYRDMLKDTISKYQEKVRNQDATQSSATIQLIQSITPTMIDAFLTAKIKQIFHPQIIAKINEIAAIPIVEQKSPEWFRLREGMISASDGGYFLKKCGASRAIDALRIKLGLKNYVNSMAPPLLHGNTYEDVTRAIYESRNGVEVTEYGILSSPTACIGASPDGIVTKCLRDTFECQSRLGRLLEIKNPYSREIDETIKPEYMVQILQQQYTTQLPICDFVETTIVDKYCKTTAGNYKPYETLAEMLGDQLDKTNSSSMTRVKNPNIPVENLNKFGNEKGLVVWYQKVISASDVRNKYVLYPLHAPYETLAIEKWIVDTNSSNFRMGFVFKEIKYWRLDVYAEKTVVYDQSLFEKQYIPQLCDVWDVILKARVIQEKTSIISNEILAYIEDLENRKDSPFYNENKRKQKRAKPSISSSSIKTNASTSSIMSLGECNDIELDF
jgi:hypothetical protein